MNPVKLYVGNLPHHISEAELRRMFLGAGPVGLIEISRDQLAGSHGEAIVEMLRPTDASLAIEYLDGTTLDGQELIVSYLTAAVRYAKESAMYHVHSASKELKEHHYPT
jgi:RNA recognition motif-containing protein